MQEDKISHCDESERKKRKKNRRIPVANNKPKPRYYRKLSRQQAQRLAVESFCQNFAYDESLKILLCFYSWHFQFPVMKTSIYSQ